MKMRNRKNSLEPLPTSRTTVTDNRGFSLVELMMVTGIIGALAMMAISSFGYIKDRAKIARAMSEIRILEKEIAAYATDKAVNPPDFAAFGRALVGTPTVCTLLDPWGIPYVYSTTPIRTAGGPVFNSDYDLYSMGPNMISADDSIMIELDDIVRYYDGNHVGSGSTF